VFRNILLSYLTVISNGCYQIQIVIVADKQQYQVWFDSSVNQLDDFFVEMTVQGIVTIIC
jgi:hypothetical protein